jgi:transposase-like protein
MKKSKFTEKRIVGILRETDRDPVATVAKRHGVSDHAIYSWKNRGFSTSERRFIISSVIGVSLVAGWASQPDPNPQIAGATAGPLSRYGAIEERSRSRPCSDQMHHHRGNDLQSVSSKRQRSELHGCP